MINAYLSKEQRGKMRGRMEPSLYRMAHLNWREQKALLDHAELMDEKVAALGGEVSTEKRHWVEDARDLNEMEALIDRLRSELARYQNDLDNSVEEVYQLRDELRAVKGAYAHEKKILDDERWEHEKEMIHTDETLCDLEEMLNDRMRMNVHYCKSLNKANDVHIGLHIRIEELEEDKILLNRAIDIDSQQIALHDTTSDAHIAEQERLRARIEGLLAVGNMMKTAGARMHRIFMQHAERYPVEIKAMNKWTLRSRAWTKLAKGGE